MEANETIIFQSPDAKTPVYVQVRGDTVWLNQYQLADLFDTDRTSLVKHIKNIYQSEELDEKAICAKFAQVRNEGDRSLPVTAGLRKSGTPATLNSSILTNLVLLDRSVVYTASV